MILFSGVPCWNLCPQLSQCPFKSIHTPTEIWFELVTDFMEFPSLQISFIVWLKFLYIFIPGGGETRFIKTRRGGRRLLHRQYVYTQQNRCVQTSLNFLCSNYWSRDSICRARCTIHNDGTITECGVHNHPPNGSKLVMNPPLNERTQKDQWWSDLQREFAINNESGSSEDRSY